MCLKRGNKKGNQRKNMKTKYEIFLQWNTRFFSSESSVCPAFRILNFLMKRTFWWKKFTYIYRASKKIPVNHHDFRAVYSWKTAMQICLTLKAPIPKNGQTLKQFFGNLSTNCVSVFDHFVKLALKGLKTIIMFYFLPQELAQKTLNTFAEWKKTIRFHFYVLLLWIVININKFSFCYSHSASLECLYCWLWMHFFGLVTQNYH